MSLHLQYCMDSFENSVCQNFNIQCALFSTLSAVGVGKIYIYQTELTQAMSDGQNNSEKEHFSWGKKKPLVVLSFKKSAKNPLKINISAKRKISLDAKCSEDIGVMVFPEYHLLTLSCSLGAKYLFLMLGKHDLLLLALPKAFSALKVSSSPFLKLV